ncbi:MAG: carboxypeptidase regulatory-like domain-containing protein [Galactobacter sp.]
MNGPSKQPSKFRRKVLAAAAAGAVLVTTAWGVAPATAVQSGAPSSQSNAAVQVSTGKVSKAAAEEKFTDQAKAELTKNKTADYWVKMKPKADLSKAKTIKDWDERGEYVVKELKAKANASQKATIASLDKADADYTSFWLSNRVLVKGGTMKQATSLAMDANVAEIHESVVMDKPDPLVVKSTKSDSGTNAVEWGIEETGAPEVWAQGITGEGITVASVDSGTQYDHPALVNQYRGNNGDGTFTNDYNWFDATGQCDGAPCDTAGNSSHGTHTMGTMVGSDGGENQVGMAPGAKWIEANGCDTCADDALLSSGQWMMAPTDAQGENPDASKRPQIVNNSWGASDAGVVDDWYKDITDGWDASGIFGVWSAGNAGAQCQTTSSPGANTANYSVGNYQSNGSISPLSSRGTGEDDGIKPNIAAPGTNIRSTIVGGQYGNLSGTSMAAPHVSGAVALLWSASPALVGDIEGTKDILNRTAIDTDDTSCGGTVENNNVFGEGKLDVVAMLDAAPGQDVGTLDGTVVDADGEAISGAEITVVNGDFSRTLATDADGKYSVKAPAGETTVTASAFGYTAASETVTVVAEESVTADFTLEAAATHTVSGTVKDAADEPVAGAEVKIHAQVDPVTTDADGAFSFSDISEAEYTVTASAGQCYSGAEETVTVDGDETVALTLQLVKDGWGYTCAESTGEYLQGDTELDLSGDDAAEKVTLPFEFPLYEKEFTEASVATNGFLTFGATSTEFSNGALPSSSAPNAAVYPFWDDLVVDAEAGVYTKTTEIDGVDAFIVEWRNVRAASPTTDRVSFSATLTADGGITFGYGDQTDTETAKGSSATVGVENATGTVGFEYSFNSAFAAKDLSISFLTPPTAQLKGKVTDANTNKVIKGATVTIVDADGQETVATTGEDGKYFQTLVLGKYTYTIESKGYEAVSGTANLNKDGGAVTKHGKLKAPRLEVDTDELKANVGIGKSVERKVKVTNTGTAPAEVSMTAGGAGYEVLDGTGSKGAIQGVTGEATVLDGVSKAGTKSKGTTTAAKDEKNAQRSLSTAKQSGKGELGTSKSPVTPSAPEVKAGETVLTHSSSQDIIPVNSAACNGGPTQVLRTFTLEDFDIKSSFDVSEVQFGVETNSEAQEVTVNLYTLDGELAYANMEKIGSATTNLGVQEATIVSVPVEGTVPAGGTLVAEISNEIGATFYVGSNAEAETAPSYIASEFCGIPEPSATADIDFPDMHVVMNVVGSSAGGGVDWLDVQPAEFTLAPGKSVTVTSTFTADVDQPGVYTATLTPSAVTPYAPVEVAAEMTVKAPAGWGKITGVVSGEDGPLEDAVVHLDGRSYDVTLRTDKDGRYAYWMQKSNAPLTVTVSANGYIPATKKAQIISGQTSVYNFTLKSLK